MATDYETVLVMEEKSQVIGQPDCAGIVRDSPAGRAACRAHIGASRLVWRDYGGSFCDWLVDAIAVPPGTPSTGDDDLAETDRWVIRVRKAFVDQFIRADIDAAWAELLREAT